MVIGRKPDVLAEVTKRLGRAPDPAVWAHLVRERALEDLADQIDELGRAEALGILVSKVESLEALRRAPRSAPIREQEVPPDLHARTLARILAAEARQREDVRRYRAEVLRGRLVAPHRVRKWAQRRGKREGPVSMYGEVLLGGDVWIAPSKRREPPRVERVLAEGPRGLFGVAVRHDGPLGRLLALARDLEREYGWSVEAGARFVLSDEVPQPASLRGTVGPFRVHEAKPREHLARITLSIDPRISPKVVTREYAELRRKAFPGRKWGGRFLTEKLCELAVFAFEHNDGRSWAEALRLWNLAHPRLAYLDEKQLASNARRAFRAVTGTDLGWQSGRGPSRTRRSR